MKKLVFVIVFIFSTAIFAQTDFSAVLDKEQNTLSISINDDGMIPPFEAGMLWKAVKGIEYKKIIREENFNLDCTAYEWDNQNPYGACTLNIPIKNFQKIGSLQVFKLKGVEASKLNRYFIDSAYVSIQGGRVYLSSYNTRREFYFGIQDSLIQRP